MLDYTDRQTVFQCKLLIQFSTEFRLN